MPKPTEIKKRLPILVGEKFEHIMADMTVRRTDHTTTITIYIEGPQSEIVAESAAMGEHIALSFTGNSGRPSS